MTGQWFPLYHHLGLKTAAAKKKWKQQSRNGEGANTRVGKYDLEKKKEKRRDTKSITTRGAPPAVRLFRYKTRSTLFVFCLLTSC